MYFSGVASEQLVSLFYYTHYKNALYVTHVLYLAEFVDMKIIIARHIGSHYF